MSFRKFQLINPSSIGSPENGHIYLGRDQYGLWEKYPDGDWVYIITGGTTGAGTSGTSGGNGSSGIDGTFFGSSGSSGKDGSSGITGTSGSSGKSGIDGTSGTSAIGSSGTSGSSGKTGTSGSSGSSGTTGTSGSSGKDGTFYGSSGTSGLSGYGGSARKWAYTTVVYPTVPGTFYAGNTSFNGVNYIRVNQQDGNLQLVDNWITSWTNGILKIEQYSDPSKFGIYSIVSGITTVTKPGLSWYLISGMTCYNGNGSFVDGVDYLISYVSMGGGTAGSSGVGSPGTSGSSGKDGTFYGSSGSSGSDGTAGTSGTSGVGSPGSSGTSGSSGYNGTFGTSGSSGMGTSGSSGTGGSSGFGANFNTDQDLYFDTATNTLFTPNIYLTGSTVTLTNVSNISDNGTKLVLSGNVVMQVTGITSGVTVGTNYNTTKDNYYIRVIMSGITITLHDATQTYQEIIIKNVTSPSGDITVQRQNSNTIDGNTSLTVSSKHSLIVKDGALNSWDIISWYKNV